MRADGVDAPQAALDRARLVNPGTHEVVASPDADAARTRAAIGDVLLGVGLAAATVGVVLLVVAPTEPATKTSRGLKLGPGSLVF